MTETAERLLADIQQLEPDIASRITEIETGRRLPLDLVKSLQSIGVFRICVPQSHGGFEFDLPEVLEVITALGRIDGSVGWSAMISNTSAMVSSCLPRDFYDEVYRNGPDVKFAGTALPGGTAEATSGGWRVNGRWPFASGCQHADWMFGLCVMSENGKPLPGPAGDGIPLVRNFLLPAHHWQIEDTWHVIGMKGSGSHHIALKDTLVPNDQFFDFMGGKPCLLGPLYRCVLPIIPLTFAALAVGIAQAALDDLVAIAKSGRQQLRAPAPMRDSEFFQNELARVAADIKAARAFLRSAADIIWGHARAGTLKDEPFFTESTQAGIWIVTTSVRAADACFALAGSAALHDSSPLQRRLRDLHTAAQHAAVQQRNYANAGKLLLGGSVPGLKLGH